jgi:glutamate dehydrogenase
LVLQERFPDQIDGHPLRRQIITTAMVNTWSISPVSFMYRMRERPLPAQPT